METQLHCFCPRRHVVRAAERGKEVVKGIFIGEVDDRKPQTPPVTVAIEQIVLAHGKVEQMPRLNAGRIVVIVLRPRFRDLHQIRTVQIPRARCEWRAVGRELVSAE